MRRRRCTSRCTRLAPESLGVLTIARLVCSFAILAIPTTMMGITLPLLTAAVSQRTGSAGTSVSLLYAMNTLGAMTGTLLTGYILIPAIGIRQSFMLAAALNVIVGVIALVMSKAATAGPPEGGHHSAEREACHLSASPPNDPCGVRL